MWEDRNGTGKHRNIYSLKCSDLKALLEEQRNQKLRHAKKQKNVTYNQETLTAIEVDPQMTYLSKLADKNLKITTINM